MPRSLYLRVEVIFLLKDPALCQRVCSQILLPAFADAEKVSFLLPHGQYARIPEGRLLAPTNETLFNVQKFFVDVAENHEDVNGSLPPPLIEQLQTSPVYEVLSAKWANRRQQNLS